MKFNKDRSGVEDIQGGGVLARSELKEKVRSFSSQIKNQPKHLQRTPLEGK